MKIFTPGQNEADGRLVAQLAPVGKFGLRLFENSMTIEGRTAEIENEMKVAGTSSLR